MSNEKQEEVSEEEYDEILQDIAGDSGFQKVSETKVLHNRPKVETPVLPLNAFLGGGFPLGIMAEFYGEPSSGKSSFSYQVIGRFQEQYPNGVAVIIDVESSVDKDRMRQLGCDPENVLRLPAGTMQEGFEQMLDMLKKKSNNPKAKDMPVLVLYDTIAISPTDEQFDTGEMDAGGMMQKPRVIKNYLSMLLPLLEDQPVTFLFLNQITTKKSGRYYKKGSGGGFGLT